MAGEEKAWRSGGVAGGGGGLAGYLGRWLQLEFSTVWAGGGDGGVEAARSRGGAGPGLWTGRSEGVAGEELTFGRD